MAEARVIELEKKVDTMLRSLNLLLFEEAEVASDKEAKELKGRLNDYLKGRLSEFVTFDEAESDKIRTTLERKGLRVALKLVTQDALNTLSAFGKPEKLREKIQEHVESGVSHPVICPVTVRADAAKKIIRSASGFLNGVTDG